MFLNIPGSFWPPTKTTSEAKIWSQIWKMEPPGMGGGGWGIGDGGWGILALRLYYFSEGSWDALGRPLRLYYF